VYQETEDVNDDESSHNYIFADVHFYNFEDIEMFTRTFEDDVIRYFTPMEEDIEATRFDRQDKFNQAKPWIEIPAVAAGSTAKTHKYLTKTATSVASKQSYTSKCSMLARQAVNDLCGPRKLTHRLLATSVPDYKALIGDFSYGKYTPLVKDITVTTRSLTLGDGIQLINLPGKFHPFDPTNAMADKIIRLRGSRSNAVLSSGDAIANRCVFGCE
jgi:hypothetical protein